MANATLNFYPTSTATGATFDKLARLRLQAGTFLPSGFADRFIDNQSTEDTATQGLNGVTATAVTTGRAGGGKALFDMTGAGGVTNITTGPVAPTLGGSGVTVMVADAQNDSWFVAGAGVITSVSAAGDLVLCGLVKIGGAGVTNLDATTQPYVYLGVVGATSTTQLCVASWDLTTKRVVNTGISLDIAANAYHQYALACDLYTMYVIVDDVIVTTFNTAPLSLLPTSANVNWWMRTTTATHVTYQPDYFYVAGQRT